MTILFTSLVSIEVQDIGITASWQYVYHICAIITRCLYIFTLFFTVVYTVEQLVLQTIHVVNKEILQSLGLKSAVYN